MTEYVDFPTLITKGFEFDESEGRRIFKGHITAEIIDKQQEFIFVSEVMKIMETFMKTNPVMSEVHTNRMVGIVLDYEKSTIHGVASVLITGEVYKVEGVTLYDRVWEKIVKGEYRGLSMGGSSKEREPIIKDGRMALELRKLELYEIAICPSPANPFAIIEKVNTFAKAINAEDRVQNLDGRCILQCEQIGMCFEKGTNIDNDVDVDNAKVHEYVCEGGDVCDVCGVAKADHDVKSKLDGGVAPYKEEHGVEPFDKPEVGKPDGMTVTNTDDYEDNLNPKDKEKDTKKEDTSTFEDSKNHQDKPEQPEETKKEDTLVGRSASTRSENIGQAGHSPKENTDIINAIIKPNSNRIKALQSPKTSSLNKQTVPERSMPKEDAEHASATAQNTEQAETVYISTEDKNGIAKEYIEVEKILPLIAGALSAVSTGAKIAGTAAEVGGKVAEGASKVVSAGSKVASAISEGVKSSAKTMTVHEAINHFGESEVRKALEELDVIRYVKSSIKTYD